MRDVRSPTLKGSNPGGVTWVLRPGDQANTTLSGSGLVGGTDAMHVNLFTEKPVKFFQKPVPR
jgi:predicted phage tail protein